MYPLYNADAPKKPTNLTINSDLLEQARGWKINISSVLEQALTETVKQKKQDAWLRENADAIEAYNRDVEESGVFSDGVRTF